MKAIVFDFDGVVVRESEGFKAAAWEEMFPPGTDLGECFAKAENMYGRGRGGDRFDILRATFSSNGWGGSALDKLVEDHARLFDENVQRAIIGAGVRGEDVLVFRKLAARFPLFLNSATPVDALEKTVNALGLHTIFGDRILGRPRTKVENFALVRQYCHCEAREILFIGDSASDVKAAEDSGCRFIGFRNITNDWAEPASFPIIGSLRELDQYLD